MFKLSQDRIKHVKSALITVVCVLLGWVCLRAVTGCRNPIVVVSSDSMAPLFHRGDLLFVRHNSAFLPARNLSVGDIVMFDVKRPVPIVHRVSKILNQTVLTKGDNNLVDDRWMYPNGRRTLEFGDIRGTIYGVLPYLGMASVWIHEYPMLKLMLVLFGAYLTFFFT